MARVVATARSAELVDNPHAGVALQAIAGEGNLARLHLAVFDEWSMLQLVQRLSGSGGGVRFAARLQGATGGNVFFAIETIRSLFESGELRFDAREGWSTQFDRDHDRLRGAALPASVVDAVRARIARLGAAAQRVVETAALAEDGSTLAELQGATALTDWEALGGIERAVAGHVIGPGRPRLSIRPRPVPRRDPVGALAGATAADARQAGRGARALQAEPARIAAHWEQAGKPGSRSRPGSGPPKRPDGA